MKNKIAVLSLLGAICILHPRSVYAVDSCNAVFSAEAIKEAQLKAKIDSDLDYTLIKRNLKLGTLDVTFMSGSTPENVESIKSLLAKWNLKFDEHGYEVFRRDYLLIRDQLQVHDFESAIKYLEGLSLDPDTRLQEIAIAVRSTREVKIGKIAPSPGESLKLGVSATLHNWSYEELLHNFSRAEKLSKEFAMKNSPIENVISLLQSPRRGYLDELETIKTLEMNYLYVSFFQGGANSFEHVRPDIHDADLLIKRAGELNKTVAEVVKETADLISKAGLDKGQIVNKKVQFFDVLPR